MKRMLAMLSALALSLAVHAADPGHGTTAEAEALVKKSIAYYKQHGKAKTMAELQKKPGPFVDRDLYVTVYDMEGNCLSQINPKMIGKNMMDLRDPDGKYLIRERLEAAQKANAGWQDYKFFNPVSQRIEPKRVYWEKYDNTVFAAGAYKSD